MTKTVEHFETHQVILPDHRYSDEDDYGVSKPRISFNVHDNGGVPFIVDIYSKYLEIFQRDRRNAPGHFRPQKLFDTPFQKVFVGDNYFQLKRYEAYGKYPGNTLLVQVNRKKYIFIGNKGIYEFTTPQSDQIVAFASPLGNSDVAYPYAIGKKYVYYMLNHIALPISLVENPTLGYESGPEKRRYYDATPRTQFKIKMLQARPY